MPRKPRRFPRFGLTVIAAGAGVYLDGQHRIPLGPGSAVVVLPDHPHWYAAVDSTWDEAFVVADGAIFEAARRGGVLDHRRPVHQLTSEGLRSALRRVERWRLAPDPPTVAARDREALAVLDLLTEITAGAARDDGAEPGEDGQLTDDWYQRSLAMLTTDLADELQPAAVAQALALPYETWRRRFRQRAGVAPAAYRRGARLDAASVLLRDTALPVREIAAAVGFTDEQHLGRHFRVRFGCAPGAWRREPDRR